MTDDEKEAIEYLKDKINDNRDKIKEIENKNDSSLTGYGTIHDAYKSQNCQYLILLNLINRLEKGNKKLKDNNKSLLKKLRNRIKEVKKLTKYALYKKEFATLNKIIKEKDKQIDLMAFDLADYVMYYEYDKTRNPDMIKAKANEIKENFEIKVKKGE